MWQIEGFRSLNSQLRGWAGNIGAVRHVDCHSHHPFCGTRTFLCLWGISRGPVSFDDACDSGATTLLAHSIVCFKARRRTTQATLHHHLTTRRIDPEIPNKQPIILISNPPHQVHFNAMRLRGGDVEGTDGGIEGIGDSSVRDGGKRGSKGGVMHGKGGGGKVGGSKGGGEGGKAGKKGNEDGLTVGKMEDFGQWYSQVPSVASSTCNCKIKQSSRLSTDEN